MNQNAIGSTWEDFKREHCTPEEIAASNLRVALMRELASVRKQKGFSQRSLGAATGISQPAIAKLEKGITSPQVDTISKLLYALGMKLAIVPLDHPDTLSSGQAGACD